ncbi:MAG: ATP-binding cassette domain-containing protein [Acidobacteriota bacterium]
MTSAPKRRFLAPEVVQTSAMDCGPASLKCLLGGFGIEVGYDRLREACQTDVDGTSIDTMEAVAVQLGLAAEQIMLPVDHIFEPAANAQPAILVVANSIGVTHFVVVWRHHGSWVQVMDPAIGRHWVRRDRLLRDVYRHRQPVPAAGWREWVASGEARQTVLARMVALGVERGLCDELLQGALTDSGWREIARLDAAVRMVDSIVAAGGVPKGRSAAALLEGLLREAAHAAAEDLAVIETSSELDAAGQQRLTLPEDQAIPEIYWSVRPLPDDPEIGPLLELRGAVLVRAKGVASASEASAADAEASAERLAPELAAALAEPPVRPGRELWRTLITDGLRRPLIFLLALVTATAATVAQVVFFRGLLDLGARLVLPEQRLVAALALTAFLVIGVLLEIPTAITALQFGRRLEVRLRQRFLSKTARLADRYFRSRLASDMAERSHNTHMLHEVPEIASAGLRLVFQALLTTAGIIWLDPGVAPIALLALVLALAVPFVAQPLLAETDLRARNHAGALSRFYLDALLGLVPARNHGAERPMRREHEGLLLEWSQAMLRSERAKLWMSATQALVGFGLAILLVFRHLQLTDGVGQVLLLAYWALYLQVIGENLGVLGRQVPHYRNVTKRLLEPLGLDEVDLAEDSGDAAQTTAEHPTEGVAVRFEGARVVAGGHLILDGIELEIEPGSHVAVVGPSGAGKSSLVGLLLGWHQTSAGRVTVDCRELDAARLDALRHDTAWVDPAVQLWNRSLLANLRYGASDRIAAPVADVIDAAQLRGLLERLPRGLQTYLGEAGALVSGGEGQRVRLARALLRRNARLVVLDEPFRGLDRSQRQQLTRQARSWWRNGTLFYISHDLAETRDFDRVIVIEHGRVAEDGEPTRLGEDPGSRYATLLAAEAELRRELEIGTAWRRWRVAGGLIAGDVRSAVRRGSGIEEDPR